MPNVLKNNNAPVAQFKRFLAGKGLIPVAMAKDLTRFAEQYERLQTERHKYADHQAEKAIREFNEKCVSDPTSENIEASASFSAEDLRQRYRDTVNNIVEAQNRISADIRPIAARLLSVVLPIVDAEAARIEADTRSTFERYGVPYDATADTLLLSLAKWREVVSEKLGGTNPIRPDHIADFIGDVRGKRFFG